LEHRQRAQRTGRSCQIVVFLLFFCIFLFLFYAHLAAKRFHNNKREKNMNKNTFMACGGTWHEPWPSWNAKTERETSKLRGGDRVAAFFGGVGVMFLNLLMENEMYIRGNG